MDGKGDTKAGKKLNVEDMTSLEYFKDLTKDKSVVAVSKGIVNEEGKKLMKAYAAKFTPEEIQALVDYVFSLKPAS